MSDQLPRSVRLVLGWILAISFLLLLSVVLKPFFRPLIWSVIVVFFTWPLYQRLKNAVRMPEVAAALLMTALMILLSTLIVVPLSFQLLREAQGLLAPRADGQASIGESLGRIPYLGPWVVNRIGSGDVQQLLRGGTASIERATIGFLVDILQGFGNSIFVFLSSLLIIFFLFLHGAAVRSQVYQLARYSGGERFVGLLDTAGSAIYGTVQGALLTALAQGCLAGLGFWVAGAPSAVFLGFCTMVLSLIPFGAPLIYLPVCLYLGAAEGQWLAAGGLLIWSLAVVSTIDNVLRTLFISQATNTPLLLIFMGVVGGMIAFGILGLIVGPVVLVLARVLWGHLLRISEEEA